MRSRGKKEGDKIAFKKYIYIVCEIQLDESERVAQKKKQNGFYFLRKTKYVDKSRGILPMSGENKELKEWNCEQKVLFERYFLI